MFSWPRWGVLLPALTLSACVGGGSGPGEQPDPAPTLAESDHSRFAPSAPDPTTKDAAFSDLDAALDRLSGQPFGYHGNADFDGGEAILSGIGDPARESSAMRIDWRADAGAPADDVPPGTRATVVDGHRYGWVPSGPAAGCWVDVADVPGLGLEEGAWVPPAASVLYEATVHGYGEERTHAVVADLDAATLLAIVVPTGAQKLETDEPALARAEITVLRGEVTALTYDLEDAVNALTEAGVDVLGEGAPPSSLAGRVEIDFLARKTVEIPRPDSAQIMQGSEGPQGSPAVCTKPDLD